MQQIKITLDDLSDASRKFLVLEKRGSFYDMALRLVRTGYELEGCVLFLATWNFASFRYAATNFDIEGLRNLLTDELRPDFLALEGSNIQNLDFDKHASRIESMFNRLSSMKEVLYTGATKLMHLKCPELFVIWDDYIRGGKPKKLYATLSCVASGKWALYQYEKSGAGYVKFLSDTQKRVRGMDYFVPQKTLAKAIDEFNYVNVTLPIQALEASAKQAKHPA